MDKRAEKKHRHELKRYAARVAKRKERMGKRAASGNLMNKSSRRSQLH